MNAILIAGIFIGAYLVGSVNFSILLFRLLKKSDPRNAGSGNPGVTNVYRQVGPAAAGVVLLLDLGRSIIVAFTALSLLPTTLVLWAAPALLIGNRYPIFHRFAGGKGVANYLGFCAGLFPAAAGAGALSWLVVFGVARKPFLGSMAMIAAIAVGLTRLYQYAPHALAASAFAVIFIIIGHRKNFSDWFAEISSRRSK